MHKLPKFPLELFQKVYIVKEDHIIIRRVSAIQSSKTLEPLKSDTVTVALSNNGAIYKFNLENALWAQDPLNPNIIYYTPEEAKYSLKPVYVTEREELYKKLRTVNEKLKDIEKWEHSTHK